MRKRTRRKVWGYVNPIEHAIQKACISTNDALKPLRDIEREAIERVATGRGTDACLLAIQHMVNLAWLMAKHGVGIEVIEPSKVALERLRETYLRSRELGRVVCTGPAITSFREMFEWHDVQRASVSRGRYEWFIDLMHKKIASRDKDVVIIP